jgi:prepilin-type processing-associated H-X9-DG protein
VNEQWPDWSEMANAPSRWIRLTDSLWFPLDPARNTQWGELLVGDAWVHVRHFKTANCWMVDGHVASLKMDELLGPTYNWHVYATKASLGRTGYYRVWDSW